jgi:putative ABC transport system ATP-binding protein
MSLTRQGHRLRPEKVSIMDAVFRTQDLTKVYDTGETQVRALDGVNLELFSGELVVLLGPSGSGKSTLLNILGGLDHASSGKVWFRDLELSALKDRELTRYRRDHVGFVFQFYNLVASLTARENVQLVTDVAPNPMPAEEALAQVGLAARMDHFPAEMSGGEQQRVAIARAIAKRPEVLLCDEPTGALDSKTGVQVLEVLRDVNDRLGTSTAVITNNAAIRQMAHRVVYFRDGRIDRIEVNDTRIAPSEISW